MTMIRSWQEAEIQLADWVKRNPVPSPQGDSDPEKSVADLESLGQLYNSLLKLAAELGTATVEVDHEKAAYFDKLLKLDLSRISSKINNSELRKLSTELSKSNLSLGTRDKLRGQIYDISAEAREAIASVKKIEEENRRLELENRTMEKYLEALNATLI